jgi:hypothetical protein
MQLGISGRIIGRTARQRVHDPVAAMIETVI